MAETSRLSVRRRIQRPSGQRALSMSGKRGAVLIGVVFLAAWEFASGRLIDGLFISRPSAIVEAMGTLITSGELAKHAPVTLIEASAGFVIGGIPAIFVGMVMGRNPRLASMLRPYFVGFYAAPRLAMVPLFIIWFGIGTPMKIYFTAISAFFPLWLMTFTGASEVRADLLATARLMRAGRFFLYRHVILPSTSVWILAGARQAVPQALGAAVVAELVASNRGVGYLLIYAAGVFDTAKVFGILFMVIFLALGLYEAVTFTERRLFKWRKRSVEVIAI